MGSRLGSRRVLRHNRLSQRGCRNGRFPLLNRQCGASVVGYVTYRIYHTYMTGGFGACARYNVHRCRLHNTKCSVTHGLAACGAASVRRSERAAASALLSCRSFGAWRRRRTLRSTVQTAERVGRCVRCRTSAARAAECVCIARRTRAGLSGGPSSTRAMRESRHSARNARSSSRAACAGSMSKETYRKRTKAA